MNRNSYRLVFSRPLGMLVPVGEATRSRSAGKRDKQPRASIAGAIGVVLFTVAGIACPMLAWAQRSLPVPCSAGCAPGVTGFVQSGGNVTYNANGLLGTVNLPALRSTLNWSSFDIAPGHKVNFRFAQLDSAVLNRIWSGDPSQINGTLTGNGQIYLVNRNGFVFGNGARVNAAGIVASALDVAEDGFENGLTSLIPVVKGEGTGPASTRPRAAFTWEGGSSQTFAATQIRVDTGAEISAESGGRVMLIAPAVVNAGSIATPEGQTILAAGGRVYLSAPFDSSLRGLLVEVDPYQPDSNRTQFSPREDETTIVGGVVTNAPSRSYVRPEDLRERVSEIVAERGNVTLAGFRVNQMGRVRATTTVDRNGSITIQARDTWSRNRTVQSGNDTLLVPMTSRAGEVVLGAESETRIDPDIANTRTTTDEQVFQRSLVEVAGKSIVLEGRNEGGGGARITAPSGIVNLTAQQASDRPDALTGADLTASPAPFLLTNEDGNGGARIYAGHGASIDVAGLNEVSLPTSRNFLDIKLLGTELRDVPLQRLGILRSKTVTVDLRKGAPLISNLADYVKLTQKGIAERSTAGGSVVLKSEGDVVLRDGSSIDISGGSVAFQPGESRTTYLSSQGRLIDLASARGDMTYDGDPVFVTRQEAGYLEGRNAGSLQIWAAQAAAQGTVAGRTASGPYQRDVSKRPLGGRLLIGDGTDIDQGLLKQDIEISADGRELDTGFGPDSVLEGPLALSATRLQADGITRLGLFTEKAIELGGALDLSPGGELEARAGKVEGDVAIAGSIVAPGGKISITAAKGDVTLETGASISTAGLWTNDSTPGAGAEDAIVKTGGKVSLEASTGELFLREASLIDVSGGAYVTASRALDVKGINAGAISLRSGIRRQPDTPNATMDYMVLGGELRGYAYAGPAAAGSGGKLSISTGAIRLGDGFKRVFGFLDLGTDFLEQGGFASFVLTGFDSVSVAKGTQIALAPQSRLLFESAARQASGSAPEQLSSLQVLSDSRRSKTSIELATTRRAVGTFRSPWLGTIDLAAGSSIDAGPEGVIKLTSDNAINIDGRLSAAGGRIDLVLRDVAGDDANGVADGYDPRRGIWLGDSAELLTTGFVRPASPIEPRRVVDGGTISVTANKGAIVGDEGALLDVSGVSFETWNHPSDGGAMGPADEQRLQLREALRGTRPNSPDEIADYARDASASRTASNGGTIRLSGAEALVIDSALRAQGGDASARGGTLEVSTFKSQALASQLSYVPASKDPVVQARLSGERIVVLQQNADGAADNSSRDEGIDATSVGRAVLGADTVRRGGFDNLTLDAVDRIVLSGDVDLDMPRTLALQSPNVSGDGGKARLGASTAIVGTTDSSRIALAASDTPLTQDGGSGTRFSPDGVGTTGSLSIEAAQVEFVGRLATQGLGTLDVSSRGDIQLRSDNRPAVPGDGNALARYEGRLSTGANLTLRAQRIYPSTATDFVVEVVDHPGGSVRIERVPESARASAAGAAQPAAESVGSAEALLSAGGKLTVRAGKIEQNGVLKAPFGAIELAAVGSVELGERSVTSVSGEGQTIPFGQTTLSGRSFDAGAGAINRLDDKQVTLTAPAIDAAPGSSINLAGGGDLLAWEFVPGPGGSRDVLDAGNAQTFAIVPGVGGGLAPYDNGRYSGVSGVQSGDSLQVAKAVGELAAGTYTLLPARYALAPGAFLVSLSGKVNRLGTTLAAQPDGSSMVAVRRATPRGDGGHDLDSLAQVALITPGSVVRTRSEYLETLGSTFFGENENSALPGDAGRIGFLAGRELGLNGAIDTTFAAGHHRAEVNIAATHLHIGQAWKNAPRNTVIVNPAALNRLKANLLVGGVRTNGDEGVSISTVAQSVTVDTAQTAQLTTPELALVATDTVFITDGSVVTAAGKTSADAQAKPVTLVGDGAYLLVADGAGSSYLRSGFSGASGRLIVQQGSRLAGETVTMDATFDSRLLGALDLGKLGSNGARSGGSLSIGAAHIALGDIPGGARAAAGFALDKAQLAKLATAETLQLRSYSTIDVVGSAEVGSRQMKELVLQGGGINGVGNDGKSAVLQAQTVSLSNPNAVDPGDLPYQAASAGQVVIGGERIELGEGTFGLRNFGAATLAASSEVAALESGRLDADGNLSIGAARITAASGVDTQIVALGTLTTSAAGPAPTDRADGSGGRLELSGASVSHGGRIELPSGTVAMTANGAGGSVALRDGSVIDVSSATSSFADVTVGAPAGTVRLAAAQGDVDAAAGSSIDLRGRAGADAGRIDVVAKAAQATLEDGSPASIGGTVGLRGSIEGSAEAGRVGSLEALAGSISVNAAHLDDAGALFASLDAGGMHQSIDVRVRGDDLRVDGTVRARSVRLATDAGSIDVGGTIDASGPSGGSIALFARDARPDIPDDPETPDVVEGQPAGGQGWVRLQGGQLIARATSAVDSSFGTRGRGGKVVIGVSGVDDAADAQTRIVLGAGSRIDVSTADGSAARGGEVVLRAPQVGGNEIALSGAADGSLTDPLGVSILGAESVVAEAVRTIRYDQASLTVGTTQQNGWRSGLAAFMQNAGAIETRLGKADDASFHLRPGLEVVNTGGITVSQAWDLQTRTGTAYNWRYGGTTTATSEPGALTLRAGGDLRINASISDGFLTALTTAPLNTSGESWSYRLASGVDRSAAHPLASASAAQLGESGNLTLAANALIRTGTGDIDIASGGKLSLAAFTSVIYTAGVADARENHGGNPVLAQDGTAIDQFNVVINTARGEFPFGGGDVSVSAAGDIEGAGADQWMGNWLYRLGRLDADGTFNNATSTNLMRRPSWWPRFRDFKHGVAALGGGNVEIVAGGAISNLGAGTATNGRLAGANDEIPNPAKLKVQGGGDLSVQAGGDIGSGFFYADRGDVRVSTDSALSYSRGDESAPIYTSFGIGDARVRAVARLDAAVGAVFNPTMQQSATSLEAELFKSRFSTYGDDSSFELFSTAGSASFNPDSTRIRTGFGLGEAVTEVSSLALAPPNLFLTAFAGDLSLTRAVTVAPASKGQIDLLANGKITLSGIVNMPDLGSDALPQPHSPDKAVERIEPYVNAGTVGRSVHDPVPLHRGDTQPVRIIAKSGDVTGLPADVTLRLAKPFRVEAGGNIVDVGVEAQNLAAGDVSQYRAAGDIQFPGNKPEVGIVIGGPGRLEVEAAKSIDLGQSLGIVSRGNLSNPALPDGGADLVVLASSQGAQFENFLFRFSDPSGVPFKLKLPAGLGEQSREDLRKLLKDRFGRTDVDLDVDAELVLDLAAKPIDQTVADRFNEALLAFMRQRGAGDDLAAATTQFAKLSEVEREGFYDSQSAFLREAQPKLRDAFFLTLRDAGRLAGNSSDGYVLGYDAVATLFPDAAKKQEDFEFKGGITLFQSQIKSEQGGGIDLFVPNGSINAGLTAASGGQAKPASQQGVITVRGGPIRALVGSNFDVNSSRVFTLQGGYILIWSSFGNIDAGRGERTASATPPPQVIVRGDQIILDTSNSVAGSGIGVLLARDDAVPDDVDLIAPTGEVNAGDAGIRSSGRVSIAAQRVVGADNITAAGPVSGVPAAPAAPAAPPAAPPSAAQAASRSSEAVNQGKTSSDSQRAGRSSLLTVEILGLGEPEDEEERRKRRPQQ